MKRLRNKIARWFSETIAGEAVVILIASAIGGFAGVGVAIEWMAR